MKALVSIICTLSLLQSPQAFAGFTTKGGGFTYQGRLLDLVEAERQGIQFISHPKQLAGFSEVVRPAIESLKAKIPRFAADLEEIVNRRVWRFVALSLPKPEDSGSPLDAKICGVVSDKYFSILKPCFDESRSAKDKGQFLLHELVRQIGLRSGASQQDVQEIIQILIMFPAISPELLQSTLIKSHFGDYLTVADIKRSQAPLSHYLQSQPTAGLKFDALSVHRDLYKTDLYKQRELSAKRARELGFDFRSDGHDYHGIVQCYNYLSHFLGRLMTEDGTRYVCCFFNESSNILSARVERIAGSCAYGDLSLNTRKLTDSMWNHGSDLSGVNIENTIRATLESGAIPPGTEIPRSY
jgi:hypothetical protein